MSPLEQFAAALQQARASMKLFHPVDTLKSMINDIDITPGQILLCRDTGDFYADLENNVRIKMSDIIFLDSDSDRTSLLAPLEGKVYIVKSTGIVYQYKNSTWTPISIMAANVTTSDGSNLETKLQGLCKLTRRVSYVEVETDNQLSFTVPFPFANYLAAGNYIEIFVGSSLIDERRYTISGTTITFDNTVALTAGRTITFIFWYNEYYDGSYVPPVDPTLEASKVVLSNGTTVEAAISNILNQNWLGTSASNVVIQTDESNVISIPFPFSNYFSNGINYLTVFYNGMRLNAGADFTMTATDITILDASLIHKGDIITFVFNYRTTISNS